MLPPFPLTVLRSEKINSSSSEKTKPTDRSNPLKAELKIVIAIVGEMRVSNSPSRRIIRGGRRCLFDSYATHHRALQAEEINDSSRIFRLIIIIIIIIFYYIYL